jgi:hypothetical protein
MQRQFFKQMSRTALWVCAPATCGVAMLVPLMVFVAVLLPVHDDVMPTPGAKMSKPAFAVPAAPPSQSVSKCAYGGQLAYIT